MKCEKHDDGFFKKESFVFIWGKNDVSSRQKKVLLLVI